MAINCQVITICSPEAQQASRELSEKAFTQLVKSSEAVGNEFEPRVFNAVLPKQVPMLMERLRLNWNYPWQETVIDWVTGLKKTPYPTQFANNRIACALSHYILWAQCYQYQEPILIMEHDAYFTRKLHGYYSIIDDTRYDIIGLNEPIGNTRRAGEFQAQVQHLIDPTHSNDKLDIVPVPTVDNFDIPQGLAGNSAYIIKPSGAENLIQAVEKYGLWPNDAIMCKQLIPRMGVTKVHFTDTQKVESTTT